MPQRVSRGTRVVALLSSVGVLAGAWLAARGPAPGLLHELTRETRHLGIPGMRVSIVSGFRPCASAAAAEPVCGAADGVPSQRTLDVIRRAEEAARLGADPEALHAAGLALMLFPSPGGNHLDRSISYLQSASRLSEQPAPVLADLSAAHLMRARGAESPRSLYQALEVADRAVELDSTLATARFNAAAALEGMGAVEQAREAWSRYLALDSTSGWADEARRRRARAVPRQPRPQPERTASRAELEAYAAATPSGARELGWDDLLREWGTALLAGDTATARVRLEQAEVLGAALVRRGGDGSLADAGATIRARSGDGAGLRRLARAHVELGEARKEMIAVKNRAACPRFRQAVRDGLPAAAREWAEAALSFCYVYGQGTVDLARVAAESDSVRFPSAAGRKWAALASAQYRRGEYVEALASYRRAEGLYTRAGERDHAATARMHTGDVRSLLGETDAGYATLHETLGILRDYPGCLGLWNGLYALRNALLADGLHRTAMRVQDEAVAVTRWMRPQLEAEMRLARARLHLAAGRRDIDEDVERALEIMKTVDDPYTQNWLRADLGATHADAWLADRPGEAAAELDSVVQYFGTQVPRLLPALFSRAQARLALGEQEQAAEDLRRAVTVLDSVREDVVSASLRASLLEQSRRVFDQAEMLSVRGGRKDEALDYVERSRASFSPVGRAADWAGRPLHAPRGQVAVEFAMVGDTLLAWTLWDGGMHFARRTVNRADLGATHADAW
ncbi:MAG TPA: hypothetical protein VFY65_10795, partial [Longimicrobium sp.]|nr:hypothetical protein [Longimicrobium sp.]